MKNDIVLCSLNSKYIHSTLSVWYLYSSIKENLPEISATVYESTINCNIDDVFNEIILHNSKIYAFSCYIWNIDMVLKLAERIKKTTPHAIVLLGGPEVSYNSAEVLEKHDFVDFIICGEGEEVIVNFLKNYNSPSKLSDVKGLSFGSAAAEPYISFCEPPSPYTDEYFKKLGGRIAYIETTRGCPYNCAFCLSGRCGGVRYFDLDRVYSDIFKLANSGTKTVKFVDRTFNANSERANKILSYILENHGDKIPENVCFHFEVAGDILREETLEILSRAPLGLFQLEIGLQTFNAKTLESINRKTNIEKLVSNIKKLISYGNMHIHIDLIAGLPLEDMNSFEKTFNTAYFLGADMLQLGFLKMLHGSPMREDSEKYPCNFSQNAPYEVIDTPWLCKKELATLHSCEEALEKLYNSSRFLDVLRFLFEEKNLNPFKLFCDFGTFSEINKKASLDDYSEMFFEFIISTYELDRNFIRDKFVCDRMASNPSGKLPAFLKEKRKEHGKIKKYLKAKGLSENFALLSTENTVVFQDKSKPRQKNGRFYLLFEDLSNFISEE